ncbi:hypothetical protein FIBSPDRAFT_1003892 [Athelia psychrophila]|uniref:Uncharacterized protein n=1 Tax=Athelia psychrophila TaxID=1759441 RepID=A0A166Q2T8_9AGAM|nr:hypothetical protein FIBSPDRAFT_1003892 [Fibularhizoctonia sp. CBS 109695]
MSILGQPLALPSSPGHPPGQPGAISGPASHNCGTREQQDLIDCASQHVLQENNYMCSNQTALLIEDDNVVSAPGTPDSPLSPLPEDFDFLIAPSPAATSPPPSPPLVGFLSTILNSWTEILLSSTGQPELARSKWAGQREDLWDRFSMVPAGQVETTGAAWCLLARKQRGKQVQHGSGWPGGRWGKRVSVVWAGQRVVSKSVQHRAGWPEADGETSSVWHGLARGYYSNWFSTAWAGQTKTW